MFRCKAAILAIAAFLLMLSLLLAVRMKPAAGEGMVGETGNTIVVIGQEQNARFPIFLVDTREQVLVVYKYDINGNSLELSVARSYQWDKKLESFGSLLGPRPDEIKDVITRKR